MHNKLLTAQDSQFSMSRRIVPIACTQNVQPHRYSAVLVRVMTTCMKNVTPATTYGECQAKKRVSLVTHEACPGNR